MFLAVRTTFMFALSHNDFAVFALESTVDCGSGFFVDVCSPFCVLCLKDGLMTFTIVAWMQSYFPLILSESF